MLRRSLFVLALTACAVPFGFTGCGTAETDDADTYYIVSGAGQAVRDFDWVRRHIRPDEHAELADAYQKGAEATKNPQWKAEFIRLHHDNLRYAAERSLGLAEVAHALTQNGTLPKDLTLEVPYPKVEGPMMVAQLTRVRDGGWIEAGDQESASIEAQRMAIENVLAQLTGGDRSQARAKLTAGPVKIDGADFGLFLGQELLTAASAFDPGKMKALCSEADAASKATATLLHASPDASKEKRLKKLQDDVKEAVRNA